MTVQRTVYISSNPVCYIIYQILFLSESFNQERKPKRGETLNKLPNYVLVLATVRN